MSSSSFGDEVLHGEDDHLDNYSGGSYLHIIFPTVLYYTIVFASFPLQIQVIIEAICNNKSLEEDDDDCDSADVTSRAAIVNTYCSLALYFPIILLTGPFGVVVNRYGRKVGLSLPIFGSTLAALCYLYIHMVQPSYFASIAVLGCFLMGITGGYSTFNMSIFSYASDTTSHKPDTRKKSFPIVEGFIFLPKLFAPICTGIWAEHAGFTGPLIACVVLGCIALMFTICFVPESLVNEDVKKTDKFSLNPGETFKNIAFIFKHKAKHGKSPLFLISFSFCLYYITYISFNSVLILYCKHVFNWGPDMIGYFDGLEGGVHASSMFFAPLLVHECLGKEFSLLNWVQSGYLARFLFFLGVALSPTSESLFAMIALLAVAGPATPYTRTILSNSVLSSEQAKIFAAFSSVESISTLLSPAMIVLYSITAGNGMPALTFYVMALLMLFSMSALAFIQMTPELRHNVPDEAISRVVKSSFSAVEDSQLSSKKDSYFQYSEVDDDSERLIGESTDI